MNKIFQSCVLMTCLVLSMITPYLIPSTVYACSCAPPPAVEAEFNQSEAVFAGRVLEVREQRSLDGRLAKAALFEVSRIWKGGSESQIIIHTGSGGGDCGYHFEEGKEYLVYANQSKMYGNEEQLTTIICDRTNELTQAVEDIATLGEGKAPTVQVNLENELNTVHPYVWVVMIGVIAIGLIILLVRRNARKK